MNKSIVLYMHVHQPFRIKKYTVFNTGVDHEYFETDFDSDQSNERILKKVVEKSYLPATNTLKTLLEKYPEFKFCLSLTGTVIEQLEKWSPETLQVFKDLVGSGRVEILAETYHHTLSFFYSRSEFEMQVQMHKDKIQNLFGQEPSVFRNTELAYNNDLAKWAEEAGYKAILAEGWDPILGWRSPNYLYRPAKSEHIKLLLKNYKLSDDIAFRFGDSLWAEYPLTADKFSHWLSEDQNAVNFNLFMDFETFGEHQWHESGIIKFLEHLPKEWLKNDDHTFLTVSEAADKYEPVDQIDIPQTLTWADTERDLSAWLGNGMQTNAINEIYALEPKVLSSNDLALIEDWRKLQTSDHFYYMCTKWFNDGDIHAYFSPYETPYDAYINYMNAYRDICYRLTEKGITI